MHYGQTVLLLIVAGTFFVPGLARSADTTTGMAAVNGAKLYYETLGHGRPLLLIHSSMLNSNEWDEQFTTFAAHYHVIRYDTPGYGKSQGHEQPYAEADDVAELLRFLNVKTKVTVMGVMAGGQTAINFALQHPEMVEALVLSMPAVEGWTYSPESLAYQSKIYAIAGKKPEEIADQWLADPHLIPAPENPAARQQFRQRVIATFQTPGTASFPPDPLDPPAIQRLAEIRVPTLVIVGQLALPEAFKVTETLTQKIANAKQVTIPKTGHFAHMERPEEFNRIVLDFLSKR